LFQMLCSKNEKGKVEIYLHLKDRDNANYGCYQKTNRPTEEAFL
jgi:hypothetical protein